MAELAGRDWTIRRMQRVHFVGIGGVGMSGIAEVLLNLGYSVSGSDLLDGPSLVHLRDLGARVVVGHNASNVHKAGVVVVSTAIAHDNPELLEAKQRRIPVVQRAEMLAEIMRFRQGIAIAGTHGKTTTTSLVTSILNEGGFDPTFVIGGKLLSAGSNARLGSSDWLVAEADESDASFLHLQPVLSVVTNIDRDHMDTYDGNFQKLQTTFIEFLHNLPFYGLAVLCGDDEHVNSILPQLKRQFITYGFGDNCDVRAINLVREGLRTHFDIARNGETVVEGVTLNLPGLHNVSNATAAIAIALELGVTESAVRRALIKFAGIGRRLQHYGELHLAESAVQLLDDYGHHPREVAATVEAARTAYPQRRLVVIFQPHRYSRTRDLLEDFVEVLSQCDVLLLLPVYEAGETPIPGADSRALAKAIRLRGRIQPFVLDGAEQIGSVLEDLVRDQDVLLTLGAGNVGNIPKALAREYGSVQ